MIRAALLVLVLATAAEALDVAVAPYRQNAQSGEVGVVTGRVYEEPRKANAAPRPLAGAVVALVPRSPALLASFERFKEDARGSSKAFTGAAPAMRRAEEAYENELVHAGAPDLASRMAVGSDGAFRLTDVPAGEWIVLVWHTEPFNIPTHKSTLRERQIYQLPPRATGFQAITIWLREVTVARGETTSVDLHDRNEWFRGVIEEKGVGTTERPPGTGR